MDEGRIEKSQRIQHIAVPHCAFDMFATAAGDVRVSVWSFKERRHLGTIDTCLSFGGRRLAVVPGTPVRVVASAYHVHGVCCYDLASGQLLWQRKDLKKSEILRLLPGEPPTIGVTGDGYSYKILESKSGQTINEIRSVRQAWPLDSGDYVVASRHGVRKFLAESHAPAQKLTKSWCEAFAEGEPGFAIAWLEQGLEIVDREGRQIGTFHTASEDTDRSGKRSLTFRIAWNRERSVWVVLYRLMNDRDVTNHLVELSLKGEKIREVGTFPEKPNSHVCELTPDGRYLISAAGEILRTVDLSCEWHFEPRQFVTREKLPWAGYGSPSWKYLD